MGYDKEHHKIFRAPNRDFELFKALKPVTAIYPENLTG